MIVLVVKDILRQIFTISLIGKKRWPWDTLYRKFGLENSLWIEFIDNKFAVLYIRTVQCPISRMDSILKDAQSTFCIRDDRNLSGMSAKRGIRYVTWFRSTLWDTIKIYLGYKRGLFECPVYLSLRCDSRLVTKAIFKKEVGSATF